MCRLKYLAVFFFTLSGSAGLALADATVDQQPLGPDGQLFGGARSPQGNHIAIFAAKGSHYQILMDGVAGPKIDNLIFNIAGDQYRAGSMWGNMPIPVIFSKDGAHWAYMAKQSDEYVIMLDGKELARGPINTHNLGNSLNLTFSANGQHLFWSDDDAQNNYVIVVDGKPGPAMRTLPQLVLSPDGSHYAYVNYNRDGTGAWAFVDGRQVNFFGDIVQYTARNMLVSTMRTPDGNNILLLNGKPEIKANSFRQITISADGKQIAMIITPQPNSPSFLTVNGKQVAGTEGLPVEKVYFSPDGSHYAALCDTKTGARFMIIDGKKGDEYPSIAQQVANDSSTHWQYVTWTGNNSDFGNLNLPVPGFTADSSKFVYVANSNGRQFLVINDDESNPFGNTLMPVLSPVGNRVGAVGVTPDNAQHILMDGKDTTSGASLGGQRISQLTFSPQGTHYAFLQQGTVYLDGVAQPGYMQGNYVFSPDDKHIAYIINGNGQQGVVVDGKLICTKPGMVNHIFFSPDSQHVYWVSTENIAYVLGIQTKDSNMLYVDGKPATHYSDNATTLDPVTDSTMNFHPEFSADDTMTFVARTDGNLRRFTVKSDTDLPTLLAAAPAAKAN
jgi:hypothetical protein